MSIKAIGETKYMPSIRISCAVVLVVLLVSSALITPAQKSSRTQDAARHASESAKTFTEIMNVKDKAIPQELLDTAVPFVSSVKLRGRTP